MKKSIAILLAALLLTGCASAPVAQVTEEPAAPTAEAPAEIPAETNPAPVYVSRFDSVTTVTLSDEGISSDSDAVYTSNDIIYYEDKTAYESGNPYGEGTGSDRHTADEAAAHTVVNITAPGAYRITGTLSAGQIRVDLGFDAYYDPDAVVELILEDANITCSVAPAILFQNVYECDGNWSTDTAQPDVDTSAAGANLILEGSSTVTGSHVAKIFKDKEGEKKLWKQDGAIYSYMSMNVFGPGSLDLTADNEGLDTELHLTLNGGDITIRSDNDGINTNEDGVSVTTVNGGSLTIYAGLGAEGDGIDSNGYLVINGGSVFASAKPMADAGLDSDLGSFIHGGTVIATGSTMDWAESDSRQVTMNLQFASQQAAGSEISVTDTDGNEVFSFTANAEYNRGFSGLILSTGAFTLGKTYHIYINGTQMAYTGTDVGFGPGGFIGGQRPGEMPQDFDPSAFENFQPGQMPENFDRENFQPGNFDPENLPEGFTFPDGMTPPDSERPEGRPSSGDGKMPEGGFGGERPGMPKDFDPSSFEDFQPGQMPPDSEGVPGFGRQTSGEPSTEFYMSDKVNAFSGVKPAA